MNSLQFSLLVRNLQKRHKGVSGQLCRVFTLTFTTRSSMCSAGHRLRFSYYNKMGFISLAQLVTPQTACHTAQVALLCQHPPANRAHLPCWTESLAELNHPALSPATQHITQLCPCHMQPLNQIGFASFLLLGSMQVFIGLRTSSCANSL